MAVNQMQAIGWLVRRLDWEDTLTALRDKAILAAADANAGADLPPSCAIPRSGDVPGRRRPQDPDVTRANTDALVVG